MKAMADRDKAKKAYNAASLKFKREEVAVQLEFINNAKNPFIIDGSDDDEDSEYVTWIKMWIASTNAFATTEEMMMF